MQNGVFRHFSPREILPEIAGIRLRTAEISVPNARKFILNNEFFTSKGINPLPRGAPERRFGRHKFPFTAPGILRPKTVPNPPDIPFFAIRYAKIGTLSYFKQAQNAYFPLPRKMRIPLILHCRPLHSARHSSPRAFPCRSKSRTRTPRAFFGKIRQNIHCPT